MMPAEEARRELVARWVAKAEHGWRLCHRLVTDSAYREAVAVADRVREQVRRQLPVGGPA
jgi:hypothetical protein